jgi:hypothetical protein
LKKIEKPWKKNVFRVLSFQVKISGGFFLKCLHRVTYQVERRIRREEKLYLDLDF